MPRAEKYEHEHQVPHHNPMSGAPAHYYQTQFAQPSYLQGTSPSTSACSPRSPPLPLSPPSSQQSNVHYHHQSSLSLSSQSSESSSQHAHSQTSYNSSHPHAQQMSPLPSILSLTSVPLTGASAPPKASLSGPGAPSSVVVVENGKKKHICGTCDRSFTTSGHLARHSRVHTGERNHKCPFPGCETRCSRQDNLQQHYRIHLSPGSRRSATRNGRGKGKRASTASSSATSGTGGDATDVGAGSPSVASTSISTGGVPYRSSHNTSKSASPSSGTPPLEQARLDPGPTGAMYYPGTGQHMVTPPDTPPALAHATLPATASLAPLNLPLVMGMQPHPATQNMHAAQLQPGQAHSPQASHGSPIAQMANSPQQQTQIGPASTRNSPEAQYPGSASDDAVPELVSGLNYRYIGQGSLFGAHNQQQQQHGVQSQVLSQSHQQHSPNMQEPTASAIAAYTQPQQHAFSQSQHSSPDPNLTASATSTASLPQYIAAQQAMGYPAMAAVGDQSRVPSPPHHQQSHLSSRHSISHISHPVTHVQTSSTLMSVSSGGGSLSSISSSSSGMVHGSVVASGMVTPDSPASLPSRRTPPTPSYTVFDSVHGQQQHHQQQQQQAFNGYTHHQQQQQPMQQHSPATYNSATSYAPTTRFPSPPPMLAPIGRSGNVQVVPREKYVYADGESYSDVGDADDGRYEDVRYAEEPRYGNSQQQHYQPAPVQQQQQGHYQAHQYQQTQYEAQQHHAVQQQHRQQQVHHAQPQQHQQDSPYMQHPAGNYAPYHGLGHGAWKSESGAIKRNVLV